MSEPDQRNTPPGSIWLALRRLHRCNRQQLADRLGVSARTLRRWEAATEAGTDPGPAATVKAALALQTALRAAAPADQLARMDRATLDRLSHSTEAE